MKIKNMIKTKIQREDGPTRNYKFSLKCRNRSGSDDVWMSSQTTRVNDI